MSENEVLKVESSSSSQDPRVEASCNALVVPEKSKILYEQRYEQFKLWCKRRNEKSVTESTVLLYLMEKSKRLKSSSLWCVYSSLKAMLISKEGIDANKYTKVVSFLKKKSLGYRPPKTKILNREHVRKFLEEANDEKYLLWKVVLIMGISGAMRRSELAKMSIDDVEDHNDVLTVTISDTKNEDNRTFTITNQDYISIYRKYLSLRPKHIVSRRLFLQYSKVKRYIFAVGINAIGKIPSQIANYLKLPNIGRYSGHCFRRSSIAIQQNKDLCKTDLKRRRRRRSDKVDLKQVEITNASLYNCRFCLKPPEDTPFTPISLINSAYIWLVLPEIDLTLIESPKICPDCFKNLENAYNFKTKCLEIEAQLKTISENNKTNEIKKEVEIETSEYEIFPSASDLNESNENYLNDTKIEGNSKSIETEGKLTPKIELVVIDDDEEEEKEEVVDFYKTENEVIEIDSEVENEFENEVGNEFEKEFENEIDNEIESEIVSEGVNEVCQNSFQATLSSILSKNFQEFYPCPCGDKFRSKYLLQKHLNKQHNTFDYIHKYYCPACDKEFLLYSELHKHRKEAHPNFVCKNECDHCGKRFSTARSLQKHRRIIHNARKVQKQPIFCELCKRKRVFYQMENFKIHMQIHSLKK